MLSLQDIGDHASMKKAFIICEIPCILGKIKWFPMHFSMILELKVYLILVPVCLDEISTVQFCSHRYKQGKPVTTLSLFPGQMFG